MKRLPALTIASVMAGAPLVARAGPAHPPGASHDADAGVTLAIQGPRGEAWFGRSLLDVFGLRASTARVTRQDPTYAITLVSEGTEYGAARYWNVRVAHLAMLGAGADGVEGGLDIDYAFGARAPVTREQGPFVRVGIRGYVLGTSELYSSLLELPTLQAGYQYLGEHVHAELAAHGGAVLAGRYNAGGGRDKLGNSPAYGGYAALRWEGVELELDVSRVAPPSGMAVDSLSGALCSVADVLGLCLDARWYRGEVQTGGAPPATVHATWIGLSVGAALDE